MVYGVRCRVQGAAFGMVTEEVTDDEAPADDEGTPHTHVCVLTNPPENNPETLR